MIRFVSPVRQAYKNGRVGDRDDIGRSRGDRGRVSLAQHRLVSVGRR